MVCMHHHIIQDLSVVPGTLLYIPIFHKIILWQSSTLYIFLWPTLFVYSNTISYGLGHWGGTRYTFICRHCIAQVISLWQGAHHSKSYTKSIALGRYLSEVKSVLKKIKWNKSKISITFVSYVDYNTQHYIMTLPNPNIFLWFKAVFWWCKVPGLLEAYSIYLIHTKLSQLTEKLARLQGLSDWPWLYINLTLSDDLELRLDIEFTKDTSSVIHPLRLTLIRHKSSTFSCWSDV